MTGAPKTTAGNKFVANPLPPPLLLSTPTLTHSAISWMGMAYSCQDDLRFCDRQGGTSKSWFQGHALWHSGIAVGIGFLYAFLRAERPAMEWRRRSSEGRGSGGEKELMDLTAIAAHQV